MTTSECGRAARHATFAVVLAGGKGTRLYELTAEQCKPAIPFAGRYRLIDFTLASLLRSGIFNALVATQYKPETLLSHLSDNWHRHFAARGGRLETRDGASVPGFYSGTADAVLRNFDRIEAHDPEHVLVLGADHIYDMDYAAMIAAHKRSSAAATVAANIVPRQQASGFGVLAAGTDGRATAFLEKPANPPGMLDAPEHTLASMGIYVFSWPWLREQLTRDAENLASSHDFGNDILPLAVQAGELYVHRFTDAGRSGYWRDVGTLDAYHQAALAFARGEQPCRLPSEGIYLSGPGTREPHEVHARLSDSIVLPGAFVEPGARLARAIVAPGTVVPASLVIGEDPAEDARWFRVSPGQVRLVTRQMIARWQDGHRVFHAPVAFQSKAPLAVT